MTVGNGKGILMEYNLETIAQIWSTIYIQIMRAFTNLRQMLATHEGLRRKIEDMERKYDQQFKVVFDAITLLLEGDPRRKYKI